MCVCVCVCVCVYVCVGVLRTVEIRGSQCLKNMPENVGGTEFHSSSTPRLCECITTRVCVCVGARLFVRAGVLVCTCVYLTVW